MKIKYYLLIALVSICAITNAQYEIVHNFSAASKAYPDGSLVSDGTYLYGMTGNGGANDSGFIFKIKPDGSDYSQIFDFSDTTGTVPFEAALFYEAGFLYGKTHYGGQSANCNHGCGVLFKIKTDGTGYTKLMDFDGISNGSNPRGSFISDGTYLYTVVYGGGVTDSGTIFKIKPDGTGYANLHSFAGNLDGIYPCGTPVSDGTFLYGMTAQGGVNGFGIIYKVKPDGTGYSKLLDFNGTLNGRFTQGSLCYDGAFLYGMTTGGGVHDQGVIFKIKTDGTNFSKLLDFESVFTGAYPNADLTVYGNFLYGMTYKGGYAHKGVVFKIDKDGNNYSKLVDFLGSSNGAFGYGSFILEGNALYGMTPSGGINNTGTIFKINVNTTTAIKEYRKDFGLSLFPNPVSTQINIQSSEALNDATITIYNTHGETVKEMKGVSQKHISIKRDNLPNGVYFIFITERGEIIAREKVVLED